MSFFRRTTDISDRFSSRKTVKHGERIRLKEYVNDLTPVDMAEMYIKNLISKGSAELSLNYRFIVQMTILIYYNKNWIKNKIKDRELQYQMDKLRETLDKEFEQGINDIVDKFDEELEDNTRLEKYSKYLTKENILSDLITNIQELLLITLKAPLPMKFAIEDQELTLYSGLGYLTNSDKLMFNNLMYLERSGQREWITPTFISTSLSSDAALSFAYPMRGYVAPIVKDVLKIVIPKDRLKYFPYNAMYDSAIQFPMSKKNTIEESEILLPPYMKLNYLGANPQKIITYLNSNMNEGEEPKTETADVIFHELIFIDYADKLALEDITIDERKEILDDSEYKNPMEIVSELKNLFIRKRGGKKNKIKKTKKIKKCKKKKSKKKKSKKKKSKKKKSKKNYNYANLSI